MSTRVDATAVGSDARARVGEKIGTSDWLLIDQTRINRFGEVTNDMDPMHVDPQWAGAHSPYHKPIAFGFLTMSLLTYFLHQIVTWRPQATTARVDYGLNYGFDRVRLLAPVPVGSRIRAHATLQSLEDRDPGQVLQKYLVEVEIEGSSKPALVAEWLVMSVTVVT